MRVLPLLLVVTLASCLSTPRMLNEKGYAPPASEPVDKGLIAYQDNSGGTFFGKSIVSPVDLKARIVKDESALDKMLGTQARKLVQISSLAWAGHSVTFQWVCGYQLRPNDTSWAYDYQFSVAQTPADILVEEFQTSGPNLRSALPFEVFHGRMAGTPFRVVGTRDLVWYHENEWSSERGSVQNTWWSFHDPELDFPQIPRHLINLGV